MAIDLETEKGRRADAQLREDLVAWLVTVSPDGAPEPTPVWFLWDGASLLVYSQRDKPKLRHIAVNPRVALALRTDEHGDNVVIITGEATVDSSTPPCDQLTGYVEKYGAAIMRLGKTSQASPASIRSPFASRRGLRASFFSPPS